MRAISDQQGSGSCHNERAGRYRTDGNFQIQGDPQTALREGSVGRSKPRMRGNNRYGTKGREKCLSCRRLKRACEFQNPKDQCDLCRIQGRPCGEKLLKSQESHDLSPIELEVKQEPGVEWWSEKEPWLPKIGERTGCTTKQIMEKLGEEYRMTEPHSAPSNSLNQAPQWSITNDGRQYTGTYQPSMDAEMQGGKFNQQLVPSQNHFHNFQPPSFGWPTSENMQLDPLSAPYSNMSNSARAGNRSLSMPSLAAGPSLETKVTISDSTAIDPRLLSIQTPHDQSQVMAQQAFQAQSIYGSNQGQANYAYDMTSTQMDQVMRY